MPTGYTQGIVSGEVESFQDFAKKCSRAFLSHMREDSIDAEYRPNTPSSYHLEAAQEALVKLEGASLISDLAIVRLEVIALSKSRAYHINRIEEIAALKIKLNTLLETANSWRPPTENHKGIGKFMREQLRTTIEADCNDKYHVDAMATIVRQIEELDADTLRNEIKERAQKDLSYHNRQYSAELERCDIHNQWYNDFIESLEEIK